MKPMWTDGAMGMVVGQPNANGKDTKLLVDVYGTQVRISGDIWLDATNMECLAEVLLEGAAELRKRQHRERVVDDAIHKAFGL